jgi:hypothetical protein
LRLLLVLALYALLCTLGYALGEEEDTSVSGPELVRRLYP